MKVPFFALASALILLMSTLSGCMHSPYSHSVASLGSIRPGYDVVYKPAVSAAHPSDAAQQELNSGIKHLDLEPDDFPPYPLKKTGIRVLQDKVEIDWTTLPITPERTGTVVLTSHRLLNADILVEYRKEGRGKLLYEIRFPGLAALKFADFSVARKVADGLLSIRSRLVKLEEDRKRQLASFESVAAQYRALPVKPKLTEEQRKTVVQANSFSQQKNYKKAIEKYLAAIGIDPVAYPAAYHNLALLHAQENDMVQAIFHMRHYLLLAPEAPDSRAAQDKIYEWEAMLESPALTPQRSPQ